MKYVLIRCSLVVLACLLGTSCSTTREQEPQGRVQASDLDGIQSLIEDALVCDNRFEVEVEPGVPWPISGYDCYTDDFALQLLIRQSSRQEALEQVVQSWAPTADEPLFYAMGDNFLVIANKENVAHLTKDAPIEPLSLKEMQDSATSSASTDPAVECSQFSWALAYSYIYEPDKLPTDLTSETMGLLRGLDKHRENLRRLDGDAPDGRILLGNLLGPLNEFCEAGGTLFVS